MTQDSNALDPQVVIVGGGTAGITVAASLLRQPGLDVAIVDPADHSASISAPRRAASAR